MAEENTCGTGMAANAILPTRMAAVSAAMAEVLTRHTDSLDPGEPAGEAEREAWLAIADGHRRAASLLSVAAERMAAQNTLPTAAHDVSALTSPAAVSAFETLVHEQERLSALLAEQLTEHRSMLDEISGTG